MRYLMMALLGVALVAAGVAGSAWLLPRYQIERLSENFFVRLDTRTGEMRLYVMARGEDRDQAENAGLAVYRVRAHDER